MAEIKKYTYKSGAVYEGTFAGALREGRGRWVHPNGETYEGEYVANKQEGRGVYTFPDTGKRYVGHWRGGAMNGKGVYYFNSERSAYYFGNYTNDKKDGSGFYLYENGVATMQKWQSGKLSSEEEAAPVAAVESAIALRALVNDVRTVAPTELGEEPPSSEVRTFQFPSGATYTGQYYGTKKHGTGYWLHPEGDSYEGQFESNKHNGWGVYIIGRSGKKFVGQWEDGKMHGLGVYFFTPQETDYYVGRYKEDAKHGRGLYHFADGSNVIQTWENGTLKQEMPAEKATADAYAEAIRKIIETTKVYAPNYDPIAFPL